MNKKILITIGILTLCIILAVGLMKFLEKPEFGTCRTDEDCKNVRCVGAYCDNGLCKRPPGETGDISRVKVAIVYEPVIDQMKDVESIANLVGETKADYVHRGIFRWRGFAESERKYDVYGMLKNDIAAIKEKNPDVIFGGAIAAQEINVVEYNPLTEEVIPEKKTWEMALDPQKYGFNITKEELQKKYREKTGDERYILPDIMNPEFQKLFLDHIKIQIDSGVDAIWIDGLLGQAKIFTFLASDSSHSS